ncbi:ATP-dependent DNA helicase RecG [Thalassobacillus devorans]|uniref:ATP-dependent DNA helicase RecG n=1 Tax=Thalassobacillus devorans TaxID=279813 RepID=A0ABQ1PAW9_9BACI|nr:ATP-dependent DNA helicase RecG [Thalassobacillus devorans]NIK27866.1 ATP-dependent DNA helicase RecG [Thalassobacillus devorans]GGC90735.1 ATP-dependent DNA helicase RecG [Thalassobacillus devorans]
MLTQPVSEVNGVGEKLTDTLNELGIYTVEDLMFYFPYRYDTYEVKPLTELVHNENATIEGEVIGEPSLTFYGRKKSRLTMTLQVDQFSVKAVMFNRAFAKKQISAGDIITVTGKWDQHRLQITVSQYKKGRAEAQNPIQPVYSLKESITMKKMRKVILTALEAYGDEVTEILPEQLIDSYKLPERTKALWQMHYPESRELLKHARRRFTYEEFLIFQLKMQLLRKMKREATEGNRQAYDNDKLTTFVDSFPFELTKAQKKSLAEILTDMKSPHRMNRLLQGDVGSGKTAVAAIALYASITAGNQGALMVPTEILAEQHYESLQEMFGDRVNIVLLTGSVKGKQRKAILEETRTKEADIIVGTHALIQEEVVFSKLGLVIVDEQHRFGVNQRRTLRDKGLHPDVLFMTATPIPRTLAITAFGDMDVSVIDEMPAGRKPVETYWVKGDMMDRVLQFIQKEVAQEHQAYVISPLIEESDKLDIQNAVDLHYQLQTFFEPDIQVGLMHGRLHQEEKEAVMQQFVDNDIQVLVSTTVVEVGVNVPNATVMVIYDAERFGLSQLHQLRGRVGRGDAQSYCILLAEPKGEIGKERMRIMTETTDGFELSEQDLKLRGPGDFFGKKQSGVPEFKVGDMVHDYRALETARKDAADIIASGRLETEKEWAALKNMLYKDEALQGEILD